MYPIKIVNLVRRVDRKESTEKMLKNHSIENYEFIEAVDGSRLVLTERILAVFKDNDFFNRRGVIGCALSHISLWIHCIEIDRPILVLEHDAIVCRELFDHPVIGCIHYLGSIEQAKKGWPVLVTPPHATNGNNYHFICRAHAYGIDPWCAKNMLAHVIKYGINESLDIMLRSDIFPAIQLGLYAYDDPDLPNTTIVGRKKTLDGKER